MKCGLGINGLGRFRSVLNGEISSNGIMWVGGVVSLSGMTGTDAETTPTKLAVA